MNIEYLTNLIMPIVFVGCLIVGYIFKKWIPADNKYIPTLLAILGAVLGCIATHSITLEAVIGGALSGLASTGAHQLFKQYIENSNHDGDIPIDAQE